MHRLDTLGAAILDAADCAPDAPELELVVEAAPSSVFAVLGGV